MLLMENFPAIPWNFFFTCVCVFGLNVHFDVNGTLKCGFSDFVDCRMCDSWKNCSQKAICAHMYDVRYDSKTENSIWLMAPGNITAITYKHNPHTHTHTQRDTSSRSHVESNRVDFTGTNYLQRSKHTYLVFTFTYIITYVRPIRCAPTEITGWHAICKE